MFESGRNSVFLDNTVPERPKSLDRVQYEGFLRSVAKTLGNPLSTR